MNYPMQIKYESDLDPSFPKWLMKEPGGEKLNECIQCGTCSATCPLSIYMDHTPRRLVNMAREGFKKEVLSSFTPWLCASCYACTVVCPRQIKMTDVMYAIKRRAVMEGTHPQGVAVSVLAREFCSMVRKYGRVTENFLVIWLFMKTSIFRFFGMIRLGLGLLRTGRIEWRPARMRDTEQVRALLEAVGNGAVPARAGKEVGR